MDVRAAVANEAGKPLSVETVQLDGPGPGEVRVEIKATGIVTPTPTRYRELILKDCSPRLWDTREPAWWSILDPA